MKKILVVLAVFALSAGSVHAHCGSCGVGHDESSADKAAETSGKMAKMEEMKKMTVVETAAKAGEFTILLEAVKTAGLEKALSGEGPFTIFAPTDKAFKALPEGTLEKLMKDKEKLASILTYHVVNGKVSSGEVVKLDKAQTLNGMDVMIKKSKDGVMINDAKVVTTDIDCSNGVIHVVDKVILPEDKG